MKSKQLTNQVIKIKGRTIDDFVWKVSLDKIVIPLKIAFKLETNIENLNPNKVIWSFGDDTKDPIITNRKFNPIHEEVTHIYRVKNIKENSTITVFATIFTDTDILTTPNFIIHKALHRQSTNYVDPVEFRDQILEYYRTGVICDELATAIQEISSRLSYRPNFINYTYREEMVGDALVKMVKALTEHKFDPEKGNPFSYFTKIAFHAFCKRIKGEKKERQTITDYQEEVYEQLISNGMASSSKPNYTEDEQH